MKTLLLRRNDRILFQGDSITDAGRDRQDPGSLGNGYVAILKGLLHSLYPELNAILLNRGCGGDRTPELLARWSEDCLALKPDVLSIMIGVNDVWRLAGEWNGQKHVPLPEYRENLATLVVRAIEAGIERVIVLSPTTVTPEAGSEMNTLLGQYADAAQEIAQKTDALFVDVRTPLLDARQTDPNTAWTPDGCHPSTAGHTLIAVTWLKALGLM